jgi:hypothetical protein
MWSYGQNPTIAIWYRDDGDRCGEVRLKTQANGVTPSTRSYFDHRSGREIQRSDVI